MGIAALVAACARPSQPETSNTVEPSPSKTECSTIHRATANMASVVEDLQANCASGRSGVGRSAGDLWIEVDKLKRAGQPVRNLEWQVSELEANLRSSRQDTVARRHILNNLSYEVEALNRRQP